MNPHPLPGPGDAVTFNQHVRSLDPQDDECEPVPLDQAEVDAWAKEIAADPAELDALQSGHLNYSLLWVKVDGQYASIYRAYEAARLHSTDGRHDEAVVILSDITNALLAELRRLIETGKIDRRTR